MELAEISENLTRKELSPTERDAETARMVAIFAERGMKAARKNGAPKGSQNASKNNSTSRRVNSSEPTAVDAIAAHTGVAKETVARRVKQAANSPTIRRKNRRSAIWRSLSGTIRWRRAPR